MPDPLKQLSVLRQTVRDYAKAYYEDDQPLVSDAEYDALYKQLQALEATYPQYADPDSPTQTVGRPPAKDLQSCPLPDPMLSLENAWSPTDLKGFFGRIKKQWTQPLLFSIEPKYDGLAVCLVYRDRELVQAITRGDGYHGESITHRLSVIMDIPRTLPPEAPSHLILKGEVYLLHSILNQLNQSGQRYSTARHGAAGLLRRLAPYEGPSILSFCAYDWVGELPGPANQSYYQGMQCLKSWKIPISQWLAQAKPKQIETEIQLIESVRRLLDYSIDGVVVKLDSLEARQYLGATSHHPRWAIAWKFQSPGVESTLRSVSWLPSRSGVLTPVAKIDPVNIDGVVVQSVTLHHLSHIQDLQLTIGSRVLVRRAGDVIPEIVRVLPNSPLGKTIAPPSQCPYCTAPTEQDTLKRVYCRAGLSCPAQLKAALQHAVSRPALNIRGIGPALIEKLVDRNQIRQLSDLLKLKEQQLIVHGELSPIMAAKLIKAIQAARTTSFQQFLFALGIPKLGRSVCQLLASKAPTFEQLSKLDPATLTEWIGPAATESLLTVLKDRTQRSQIQKCLNLLTFTA